jgi:hypothetical protein
VRILKFLASLKLAVLVILGLAFACATATVLESLYDTPTAKYWVYSAFWFRGILALMCINLAAVMVDRWPWKVKHIPFLLAHIGILLLMFGSWLTEKTGLDGSLRITEGESGSIVEVDEPMLVVTEKAKVQSFPVKWIPPEVQFAPRSFKDELGYDLKIQDYITHADPLFEFVQRDARVAPVDHPKPALKLTLTGGPMQITQDFWLWTGDPSTQGMQAGPAWLELTDATDPASPPARPDGAGAQQGSMGPKLSFKVEKGGILSWRSVSSTGEVTQGRAPISEIKNKPIDPRWKMVKITLNEFIPDAWVSTTYKLSRIQHGQMAPPSAVHVVVGEAKNQADVWLGMGSRAVLNAAGREIEVGYFPKRLMLPFSVRLDHFTVDRYQGTNNPAAYSSKVTVLGGDPNAGFSQVISMNEPLEYKGITLYQASYEDAQPRPVTSILSVNRDPGRHHKYIGSLLIVLGSAWLFAVKYRSNKKSKQSQTTVGSSTSSQSSSESHEAGVSV